MRLAERCHNLERMARITPVLSFTVIVMFGGARFFSPSFSPGLFRGKKEKQLAEQLHNQSS